MKPLLALVLALMCPVITGFGDQPSVAILKNQAEWALRNYGVSRDANQRAGYVKNVNDYAAVLQEFLGQKPEAVKGDMRAAIDKLEKLARAKTAQLQADRAARDAAAFERAAGVLGANNSAENWRRYQRIRDLESEIAAGRVRQEQIDNARRFNEKTKR